MVTNGWHFGDGKGREKSVWDNVAVEKGKTARSSTSQGLTLQHTLQFQGSVPSSDCNYTGEHRTEAIEGLLPLPSISLMYIMVSSDKKGL